VQLAEGYAAGTLTPEERALVETRRAKERERRESKRKGPEKGVDQEAWKGGVIIDLGFDELMTDQVGGVLSWWWLWWLLGCSGQGRRRC
jgi:tRNA (guanine9-N1)-methyltransferase